LIIRRLIVPLTVVAFAAQFSSAVAQSAFPAPLPGQAAPAAASPFPPVGGAPTAPPAASPFPPVNGAAAAPSAFSNGAPPVGAFSQPAGPPPGAQAGPPGGDDCMKEFAPLRDEAQKRGNAIKAASDRKASPDEACKLIGNFAQAEIRMIKYVETNSQKCGIPPQVSEQLKTGQKNTMKMQKQVCQVAQQQQQQQRGPAAPSLADVLGSSAAMPSATATKRGGSTFDTLNGNVLAR
jgi:hypothetical protein